MDFFAIAAIFGAGIMAGTINVVAGAGTLITFPVLLALGVPPVTANVSNTVGLVPASVTGAIGYRRELFGQWRSVALLAAFSAVGGIVGGALVLMLPATAFSVVVPFLLLIAAGLAAAQPRVARYVRRNASEHENAAATFVRSPSASFWASSLPAFTAATLVQHRVSYCSLCSASCGLPT